MKTFKIVSVLMLMSALITYPAYKYWPGPAILNSFSGLMESSENPHIAPMLTFVSLFVILLVLLFFMYFILLIKFAPEDEEKYWQ